MILGSGGSQQRLPYLRVLSEARARAVSFTWRIILFLVSSSLSIIYKYNFHWGLGEHEHVVGCVVGVRARGGVPPAVVRYRKSDSQDRAISLQSTQYPALCRPAVCCHRLRVWILRDQPPHCPFAFLLKVDHGGLHQTVHEQ